MGQEVKNPLRAQSKYGLMGSSAKTGKNFFEGHRSTFWIKMQFGKGHPPHLHINCSLHVWGRVQGSQIFKRNSIISICSKVMAFLVISLSLWCPHCPHHPHIVPVIPMSSLCRPRHPHIIPIAPRRSPCGPHDLWSPLSLWSPPHVVPMVPTSSLSSPHHPHHPHVVPIAPRRSPCGPHDLWSPWSLLSPWSPPHVIPVVPMSFPCHPRGPHVVPVSSPSSPHCLEGPHIIPNPADTHSTHPHPLGGGGPKSVKMQ